MATHDPQDFWLTLRHHNALGRDPFDPSVSRAALNSLERRSAPYIALSCLLLIALIGVIDYRLGPDLSFAIFYLIPIAIAAWWGGFAFGILFSLISTVTWHLIDLADVPGTLAYIRAWNGVVRFGFFVITSSLLARLRAAMHRERTLARTDPLTGVANGRTFFEKANLEIHRFARTRRPFTLVYLDLDNFKEVNDRRGHLAGDQVLREVADTLQKNTRVIDLIARLGGDEFVVLLPETDAAGAVASLTKLREALVREAARLGWPITCSIGAATFLEPPRDVDVMIQRVDRLMYTVKHSGKNRIQHEVIVDPEASLGQEAGKVERRATVRILCNQAARVCIDGQPRNKEEFATIRNISASGLGIRLGAKIPEKTLLTIEPLCGTRIKTMLARVVRTRHDKGGWFHGCELASRLSEEDLQDWLAEAALVTMMEEPVEV